MVFGYQTQNVIFRNVNTPCLLMVNGKLPMVESQKKHLIHGEFENYYCYKKNVLSPADGIVVAVNDGCADSPIVEEGQAACAADDIRGNFIIIRHGNREYSLIAHLLANSICVKPGDKVIRGQIIARCGNSGNTSEPHIHFQIQAGKSFLISAGLPIKFYNIEIDNEQLGSSYITKSQFVRNI